MCASYTATYLTLKEKSVVNPTSAQSHKKIKATVDKFQHDKLPAVQIRLKREAREKRKQVKEQGRLIGQPETFFFLLGFDYIHTFFGFFTYQRSREISVVVTNQMLCILSWTLWIDLHTPT